MSIEEQVEIVESNIAEYGVCDITIEEYRYLKQKIRADAIEEILKQVEFEEKWLFECFKENGCKYSSRDIDIAFTGIKHHIKSLKEQK